MGTQSLTADQNVLLLRRSARPGAADTTPSRYQINVIAGDVADVVQSVGGWLFDQTMAGWDVNVLLADVSDIRDVRPLRILGVQPVELLTGLSSMSASSQRAAGLAVASQLLGTDERIDAEVLAALQCGDTEVALWGDVGFAERGDYVRYRPSAAARIFKSHAVAAASVTDVAADECETLFRSGHRLVDSLLIPGDEVRAARLVDQDSSVADNVNTEVASRP
jgi:hypothetical protein